MSFLTGTHRFLDPKCNEVLDQFYECIEKKTRALGACEDLLIKLYRCKKEDVSVLQNNVQRSLSLLSA